MYIKQLYTNCLAQAAYYIESDGEALIVDPMREPQPYLDLAKERNAKIKYVFETHFHADFVSGHLDLARHTNAVIIFGPGAKPSYPALIAHDKEKIKLGKIIVEVLHTPGHTIESSCLLVYNQDGVPAFIFTGDTLFVGDVGRPDLMSGNLSKEELAAQLYDSIQRLKKLPDEVIVYPGHGAGSACGKNIGKENVTTIGEQKKNNYAMKESDKDVFIAAVTSELPTPPSYFFKDAKINIAGYDSFELLMNKSMRKLSVSDFKNEMKQGALVLDTRDAADYGKAHITGSINVGLNGDFAVWVGTVIEFGKPLLLICYPGKEEEAITRLARIGYVTVKGILEGGISAWQKTEPVSSIITINSQELKEYAKSGKYILLDVRKKAEREKSVIKDSVHVPLNKLVEYLPKFDHNENYIVYCVGGYRSMIACSILEATGIICLYNVNGGINNVKKEMPELVMETV